jgi:rubredoxin
MRSLVPYFFISTHPVGWQCSQCGQIFRVPLNVMGAPSIKPHEDVKSRFEAHSCMAYRVELEKRQQSATASGEESDS